MVDFNIYNQSPINKKEEDCLHFDNYISGICAHIRQQLQESKNACIGILGKWGDGKTSAINLCLTKLSEDLHSAQRLNYVNTIVITVVILLSFIIVINNWSYISIAKINLNSWIIQHIGSTANLILILFICISLAIIRYKQILSSFKKTILKIFNFFIKNQLIIIKFSPWDCSNKEQMLNEYLKLLSNELGVIPNVSKLLIKYSKLISGINLDTFTEILSSENDITTIKSQISEVLTNTDKKIIVVIDDFDRILGDEVFNMLRLIGTIANFPNIVNIVAYDKEYVCEHLQLHFKNTDTINNPEKYIQKIITREFPLPKISHKTLFDIFLMELK